MELSFGRLTITQLIPSEVLFFLHISPSHSVGVNVAAVAISAHLPEQVSALYAYRIIYVYIKMKLNWFMPQYKSLFVFFFIRLIVR